MATRTPTTPALRDVNSPTRRRFLTGTAAALTGAGLAAVYLTPDPDWTPAPVQVINLDAHLLNLCAAYHAAHAHRSVHSAAWDADEAAGHLQATEAVWQAAWDANCDAENAAADAVLPVQPQTLLGLAAKAAVAQSVIAAMRAPGELLNFDEVCAEQVLADTLALAGRA